jgi:hypothetical protein
MRRSPFRFDTHSSFNSTVCSRGNRDVIAPVNHTSCLPACKTQLFTSKLKTDVRARARASDTTLRMTKIVIGDKSTMYNFLIRSTIISCCSFCGIHLYLRTPATIEGVPVEDWWTTGPDPLGISSTSRFLDQIRLNGGWPMNHNASAVDYNMS